MKRNPGRTRSAIAALLVGAAVTVAACDSGDGAGGPANLVMWNIPLSDAYSQFWNEYVDEFNASHPDIEVTYEEFDTETLTSKVRAALLAGTEPDIWFFFPGEFTTLNHRQGRVRAIDDLIPVEDYTPEGIRRCSDGDSVICLPLFLAPSAVYYNTALFADAGIDPQQWADPQRPTLEEFYAALDALVAAGVTPLALGNSGNWPLMHYYWAAQNRYGGTAALNDAALGQNGGTYEHPSFVRAGSFVQDLVDRGSFPDGFNGMESQEMYSLFHQSDAAMIYMGPWIIAITEDSAGDDFDYGLFDFPSVPDGAADSQQDIMAGLDALFVSSSTDHPEAVGEFLSGFSEPATAQRFMIETHNISVVQGVQEQVVASGEGNEKLLQLADLMAAAEHTYQWWDWLLPPVVAEEMLNLSQPLSLGEVTPEEAAARLEQAARD